MTGSVGAAGLGRLRSDGQLWGHGLPRTGDGGKADMTWACVSGRDAQYLSLPFLSSAPCCLLNAL